MTSVDATAKQRRLRREVDKMTEQVLQDQVQDIVYKLQKSFTQFFKDGGEADRFLFALCYMECYIEDFMKDRASRMSPEQLNETFPLGDSETIEEALQTIRENASEVFERFNSEYKGRKEMKDQRLQRLEEALSKALSNPQNNSLEKVKQEVKGYEEFKDWDIDSVLAGSKTMPGMHGVETFPFGEGLKTQVILTDKDHHEKLPKQGVSEKAILLEEIMKREDPDLHKLQGKLRGIVSRFEDAIDTSILRSCEDNMDEVGYALFYLINYVEEMIKYLFVELKGEDLKKIEDGIVAMQEYGIGVYQYSLGVQNDKH